MKFPNKYKILSNNFFEVGEFSIIPIRYEDRYPIMTWRNQQIYHLRQKNPLTKIEQDNYFNKTVNKLFNSVNPKQVLFSYMNTNKCIGYGGLVHINWIDKNAEISFIMNTILEKKYFSFHWHNFLKLIENVAFNELGLHKIYVFAFDMRPHLYEVVESAGYQKEAELKEHYLYNEEFKSAIIYSKIFR